MPLPEYMDEDQLNANMAELLNSTKASELSFSDGTLECVTCVIPNKSVAYAQHLPGGWKNFVDKEEHGLFTGKAYSPPDYVHELSN